MRMAKSEVRLVVYANVTKTSTGLKLSSDAFVKVSQMRIMSEHDDLKHQRA